MRVTTIATIATTVALTGTTNAKTISILLGKDKPLTNFMPDNIKAEAGDVLEFRFDKGWHRVVQGSTEIACSPAKGGFYSNDVKAGDMTDREISPIAFRVTVKDTEPIYLYDGIAENCKNGIVAIVNPKTDKDLGNYAAACASVDKVVNPTGPAVGGEMVTITPPTSSKPTPSTSSAPGSSSAIPTDCVTTTSVKPTTSSTPDCNTSSKGPATSTPSAPISTTLQPTTTTIPKPTNGTVTNTPPTSIPVTAAASGLLQASAGLSLAAMAAIAALLM